MRIRLIVAFLGVCLTALAQTDPGVRGGPPGAGGPLSGLTKAELKFFDAGRDDFNQAQSVTGSISGTGSGLGPRFNLDKCAGCHAQPAIGGVSPAMNPQFALKTSGKNDPALLPFVNQDGPVLEARYKSDGQVHPLFVISGRSDAPGATSPSPISRTSCSRTTSASARRPRPSARAFWKPFRNPPSFPTRRPTRLLRRRLAFPAVRTMTDDLAALLDHLHSGPVDVLGWSDGGIEALLLGIRHPEKVKKIAAMAANLNPSGEAVYPEVIAFAKSMIMSMPAETREIPQGKRELKVTQMLLDEPHIDPRALEAIAAPTLVLASDHDLIRDEHTLEIYHHIPNSQLCIFPNATHMVPYDDPDLFNRTVERFFRVPFAKKDRMKDFLKSFEAMRGPQS